MKLSEVEFKDIVIGQRVQSNVSNVMGSVTGKMSKEEANDREGDVITIDWDNGKTSKDIWHFWCELITVINVVK